MTKQISYGKAYLAWAAVASFYFFQYVLRVFPNIMVLQVRADYAMTAEQFSLLGAINLYAYAMFQVPLGIITDRVGIKKVVTWSIILCILGTYLLITTHNLYLAYASRFLTGLGSGCALMIALKIVSDYLPVGRRGLLIGSTLTIGTIGPIIAGTSLVTFLKDNSWRDLLLIIDFMGLILLLITFLAVFDDQKKTEKFKLSDLHQTISSIKEIFKNKNILYYSLIAIGLYAPFSVMADLWATDFLMKKYHLAQQDATSMSSILYIGLGVGCLVLPLVAEKYNKIDLGVRLTIIGLLISFVILLYGTEVKSYLLMPLLFFVGFFSGGEMICFTGASLNTNPKNSGLVIGMVNTFNMLGSAIAQQAVGLILDLKWSGTLNDKGLRYYSSKESVFALSFLLILIILCMVLSIIKPKKITNELINTP